MNPENIILIVDDEPIGRNALQAVLLKEGYRLEFAQDGPTALKMAKAILPDLILLDVMMPGMDGYEVCRLLRGDPDLAEVPVLMVTALDDAQSRLTGIEAGADDFITKPFDRLELRARVRTILRLNRFRRIVTEREKYRFLFDCSPCGLLVIDGDTTILESNSTANRFLENLQVNARPMLLLHLVSGQNIGQILQLLDSAKASPLTPKVGEFTTRGLKGNPVFFELSVSVSPPGGGGAFQVALRDLTRERLLELELRQSQKMETIGRLADGIAREFQSLLNTVNDSSEMALALLPPDESVRKDIKKVLEAGQMAMKLTRQLLVFRKPQSIMNQNLDLNLVVSEMEKMLRHLLGEGINLTETLSSSNGNIRGDRSQVEQIIMNLAVNARDAMPKGGTLTMETSDLEDEIPTESAGMQSPPLSGNHWVRLSMTDTGCGMSPEVKRHLFEPFFTTKKPGQGSGLGLATVFGIVQQSAGRIHVETEVGKGTTFHIDFPRGEEPGSKVTANSGLLASI